VAWGLGMRPWLPCKLEVHGRNDIYSYHLIFRTLWSMPLFQLGYEHCACKCSCTTWQTGKLTCELLRLKLHHSFTTFILPHTWAKHLNDRLSSKTFKNTKLILDRQGMRGARERNILQLDDKQVPDIHDNVPTQTQGNWWFYKNNKPV